MNLFVAGLSYRTAPVELREQLAVTPTRLGCHGCRLRAMGGLGEVVLLSTCNRVEIYGTAPAVHDDLGSLLQLLAPTRCDLSGHWYVREGTEALAHLFAVASGLDSMVLGETEITGQVKNGYERARAAGLTSRTLNRVFQKALQTAKEIRTRTLIGRGATSVGSVAVELAEKIFGRALSEKTVIIVGAGQMGEACVRHLAKNGAKSLLVANRCFERAQQLTAEVGGRAMRFDEWRPALAEADILITSIGCQQVLLEGADVEQLMRARRQRPLFLIDLAVPRNIDPAVQRLDNVYLYDIDDLEAIVRQNIGQREQALAECQEIIARKVAPLVPWLAGVPKINQEPQAGWALSFRGARSSV